MENSKIQKVLFNQVSLCLAIVGVVSSFIFWTTNPVNELKLTIVKLQTQLESNQTVAAELQKIKNNDLHEIQLRMDRMEARQVEELQAIARLEAILSKNNR